MSRPQDRKPNALRPVKIVLSVRNAGQVDRRVADVALPAVRLADGLGGKAASEVGPAAPGARAWPPA